MYCGTSAARSKMRSNPFCAARSRNISSKPSSIYHRSKFSGCNSTRPASILENSNTSLMSASKCSPLLPIIARLSCWLVVRLLSYASNSLNPKIALSGVRNSWLMFARKVLLARFAASAACCAASAARWARTRSVTSRIDSMAPTTLPFESYNTAAAPQRCSSSPRGRGT